MLEFITLINGKINSFIWGPVMLVLLVGTGVYLTCRTGCIQASKFGFIMKNTLGTLFNKDNGKEKKKDDKNLTPFQAVTTALAGTVGTGNIAGVTGAIFAGGPGAVFWMWVSAFFGMFTKFAEILLAMHYRQTGKDGTYYGGPMYYIEKGLNMKWLAVVFAVLGGLASFGIGNIAQSSEIAGAMKGLVGIPTIVSGIGLAVLVAVITIGGVKRIGAVTSLLVPFMSVFYIAAGIVIIVTNLAEIPGVFALIFKEAFSFKSIGGGIFGYTIMVAMRQGFARGVFSNEAGLGSAPIAHAASTTEEPVEQAMWGVFEVFIDTIVICSITAFTVLLSGIYTGTLDTFGTKGAAAAAAFNMLLPGTFGGKILQFGLLLFALSTILSWSYYGERCWGYLSGNSKAVDIVYKLIFVFITIIGATGNGTLMWDISDTLNGMMAIPNLIGLLLLSGTVIKLTKEYFNRAKAK